MKLASLLEGETYTLEQGPACREITGLSLDSRSLRPGDIFFAVPGANADGHRFIADAVTLGACAVVHSRRLPSYIPGITYIMVPSVRRALSRISAKFYGHPSKKIKLIGITGTNGKTTTAAYLYHLLNALGWKTGIISGYYIGTPEALSISDNGLSTPEAPELHRLLNNFLTSGCRFAAAELTSHALSELSCRTEDLALFRMIYTPVARDHLDYHRDIMQYYRTKLRMTELSAEGEIFCSSDNPLIPFLENSSRRVTKVCPGESPGGSEGISAVQTAGGSLLIRFREKSLEVLSPPREPFLQENFALALSCIHDFLPETCKKIDFASLGMTGVPGRGERIYLGKGREAVIDYAHNPQGFSAVLQAYPRHSGRTLVLFGAAGERDTGKRKEMAGIADSLSDIIILTEEDPFSEPPLEIIKELHAGITRKLPGKTLFVCPSRSRAVSLALSLMEPEDRLFLLGKGHEKVIRKRGEACPWNEREELLRIAKEKGFDIG